MASIGEHRSISGLLKLNVSLSVCVALNRYIKIRKIFEDSKSAQISANVFNLVSYPVYDVGVLIAATSVTLERRHRCQCKSRGQTRTPIGIARSCASGCEIKHSLLGLCVSCPTLWDRIIESQPTLGLWDMYAAGIVATVTAEQSDAPLWPRNLPPHLS